ncbi:MAG TPA: hypothetical protein VG871_20150 [Vicinamibacterales bacterium]|nr:hypothetical protein [Vicinamibacterales bacterium]
MTPACCEAANAPSRDSRPTTSRSYASDHWRQAFDARDVIVLAREKLSDLRAAGLTEAGLFARVQRLIVRATDRDEQSRREWLEIIDEEDSVTNIPDLVDEDPFSNARFDDDGCPNHSPEE